eukprot:4332201-Prymnesium_polylepis.1
MAFARAVHRTVVCCTSRVTRDLMECRYLLMYGCGTDVRNSEARRGPVVLGRIARAKAVPYVESVDDMQG